MKEQYYHLSKYEKWFDDNVLANRKINDKKIRTLALDRGSLTASLMDISDGQFEVKVLSQKLGIPFWHEQKKLARPISRASIIREVELLIHGQAVVFARTIIPLTLLGSRLKDLGKTPLGHLLFKNGRIRVSKRQFAIIEGSDKYITARRTPYEYQGEKILVSEFFLPQLKRHLP